MNKPLGVILCGGQSSRMAVDKSLIAYHGVSQREHLKKLLQPLCHGVILSIGPRKELQEECFSDRDEYAGYGPLSGLLTASHYFPGRDFLLVGCDYPLIRRLDLHMLLESASGGSPAVSFRNSSGMAEPLIAFYSSAFCKKVYESWQGGEQSLRRMLENSKALLLDAPDPRCLISADRPEDAARVLELIRDGIFTFV